MMLWALHGDAGGMSAEQWAIATDRAAEVQRVATALDLAVGDRGGRPRSKIDWDPELEYLDLVMQIASCETTTEVGGSAGKVNYYIPRAEARGVQMMAAAQQDLNWQATLASPNRDAAIESLEKELDDQDEIRGGRCRFRGNCRRLVLTRDVHP